MNKCMFFERVFSNIFSNEKKIKMCSDTFFSHCRLQMKEQQFMQRCNFAIFHNITLLRMINVLVWLVSNDE